LRSFEGPLQYTREFQPQRNSNADYLLLFHYSHFLSAPWAAAAPRGLGA
jgi:hypothetical protein